MSVFSGNSQKLLDELTERLFRSKASVEKLRLAVTDEDRINVILQDDFVMDQLRMYVKGFKTEGRFAKSREKSVLFRQRGNTLFEDKEADKDAAMEFYRKAIAYAPDKSLELRLAFGNRSALNFHKKYYHNCLSDIEFALEGEESEERRLKLYVRRGKALIKMKLFKKASEAFSEAKSILKALPKSSPSVSKFGESIEAGLTETASKEDDPQPLRENDWDNRVLPKTVGGENPEFPYASSHLTIKETKAKGRHVVATKPIELGDVLFVEKPVAFVVLPDFATERCHHCCAYLDNPLPCTECAGGNYCSVECRGGAWEAYHKYECGPGIDLAYSLGIAHLGLRLTLLGAHLGLASPKYQQILQLVHHLPHTPVQDLAQYAISAALLGVYLETCTDYLIKREVDGKVTTLESVSGSLLCHIGQMICNGHAIMGLNHIDRDNEILEEDEVRHATAIYPSASMMNHSCDSNIMNTFDDQHLIVKATRSINVGEEVYNCYGPHFRRMLREDRQRMLKEQYNFDCDCPPCAMPFATQYLQRYLAYRCKSCSGPVLKDVKPLKCLDCQKKIELPMVKHLLQIADNFYQQAEEYAGRHKVEEALLKYIEVLKIYNTVYYKYHKDIGNCKDKIARCYAELVDFNQSFKYLEENLVIAREQFGENSAEYALEIIKLSDICTSLLHILPIYNARSKAKKTLNYIQKAKKIIEIYYGKWNSKYQEILLFEEELAEFMARDSFEPFEFF